MTVFLIGVKLGHEIVERATVVSAAIFPDQSSSMEKGQERCEWMELYRKRQSRLRPERASRERSEEERSDAEDGGRGVSGEAGTTAAGC